MTDEKKITGDTQPTSSAGTGDQLERADEEAARAAAAADDAVEAAAEAEAAADAGEADPEVADEAIEAADEAVAAAEEAAEAAEEAAEAPKPKRARKARAAEVAADQAEDAADEAAEAAEKAPDTQPTSSAGTSKPKRTRTRKKAEPVPEEEAKPAEETPAPAARPRRRDRRAAPVGVEVRAQARYVRTSARKARLVCDHIRGKDVAEARAILAYTPRSVAKDWAKLLESAVANAEHNHELVGEELKIASVYADEGPTLKRFRPRAMGRATRIRKRTSHLTITLTPKEL